MKKNNATILTCSLLCLIVFSSCYRDETKFYEDQQAPGLSIFSDKADNIMSCYINSRPWKTFDRTLGGLTGRGDYETFITRKVTSGTLDTLLISWFGGLEGVSNDSFYQISLVLPVSKSFTYSDFNKMQGTRLALDTTNGFFTTSDVSLYNGVKGVGNIYFHFAELDSVAFNTYRGRLSGLFEADLGSIKIRSGRFDHVLDPDQVRVE